MNYYYLPQSIQTPILSPPKDDNECQAILDIKVQFQWLPDRINEQEDNSIIAVPSTTKREWSGMDVTKGKFSKDDNDESDPTPPALPAPFIWHNYEYIHICFIWYFLYDNDKT